MVSTLAANPRGVPIDGTNGAGKTVLMKALARRYSSNGVPALAVSTGDLYRVAALAAFETAAFLKQTLEDLTGAEIAEIARRRRLEMHNGSVYLDGKFVPRAEFRTPLADAVTPRVSHHREVREHVDFITARQIDEFDGFVFVDGRATAVDVLPSAPVKIFLTVDEGESARRQGRPVDTVKLRNLRDTDRLHGSQIPAPGAIVIDTTPLRQDEVEDLVHGILSCQFPELSALPS